MVVTRVTFHEPGITETSGTGKAATNGLSPGGSTQRHYHRRSEEIYFLLEGRAEMELEGELFAHLDRRGGVIQPCDRESHRRKRPRSPTCAAQVQAEPATTATAIRAAFRPRQPAVTRR